MSGLLQDLRYAPRQLRKSPLFHAGVRNRGQQRAVHRDGCGPMEAASDQQSESADAAGVGLPNRDIPIRGGYEGNAGSDFSTTGQLPGTSFPYLTSEATISGRLGFIA
jgi:hypothetical protein